MSHSLEHRSVVVIGAGITGLSTAFALKRQGYEVTVLERASRAGGVIQTFCDQGYLVEAGPNALLLDDPRLEELIEHAGLGAERVNASALASKRFLVRSGRVIAAPSSLREFVRSPLLSARGKLRLLAEPFAAKGDPATDESVTDFFRRRLGQEALDYGVNPLVGGVYAGDPNRLSMRQSFPRLYELEQTHGSLVRGGIESARARRRIRPPRARPQTVSFRGGLGALVSALASILGADLLTGVELQEVASGPPFRVLFQQNGATPRELSADSLIVTTPAYASALLPLPSARDALSALVSVEYPPLASVALGFARRDLTHALDGFGVLVPECESLDILGALFTSSLFSGRAPQDHELLTSYVGGMRNPELAGLPEAELVQRVTASLQKLGVVKGDPAYQRVTRHRHAIPQYHLGFERVRAALDTAQRRLPGLFFGGPMRGGASVGDCIRSGLELAARIAA